MLPPKSPAWPKTAYPTKLNSWLTPGLSIAWFPPINWRKPEAGIRPERKKVYELANGQPVEYEMGFARVQFMGEETVAQVIFGPANVEPILGAVALENVGIVVDPSNQTLKRLPASPLKALPDL